jgi:L-fuconolactonase
VPEPILRVVDAHVHHWDPGRIDWYPYLAKDDGLARMGISDISGMRRPFSQDIYLDEAADWHVDKYVHVIATTFDYHLDETNEVEQLAVESDVPIAIIGGIDPRGSAKDLIAELDAQQAASHFRGVRISEGVDHESDSARVLLRALQERELVYDLVVHPDDMVEVAESLRRYDTLTVVVEHTGWPLSEDREHFEVWHEGISRLADLGDRVHCKLSGLAMTLNRFDVDALRPWTDHCINAFGDTRCFFASNFPVDGMAGSYDELYTAYDKLTASLSRAARERLFATNAERVYNF